MTAKDPVGKAAVSYATRKMTDIEDRGLCFRGA